MQAPDAQHTDQPAQTSWILSKRNREKSTKKFRRCDKRDSDGCKARIHTDAVTDQVIKRVIAHTHGFDAGEVEASAVMTEIRRRAKETVETPAAIMNEAFEGASTAAQGKLPPTRFIRRTIQRRRAAIEAPPSLPVSRASFVIPEAYKTYGEERFLLYDSGLGDEDRILIFGRQSQGASSMHMKAVYADGTFSIAPDIFEQLYVLLAEREGFVFPLLYALLPNKQEPTYSRMFRAIRDMWPQLSPESISMDFEMAAINAAVATFPSARIFGCFFHLVRNLYKQLNHQSLLTRCRREPEFGLSARMIASLAFVSTADLDEAIDVLGTRLPRELLPTLYWFEENYVGAWTRHHSRREPLFPPSTWSTYDRALAGIDRTNNFAEAAHRRIRSEIGAVHTTLWRFIDGFRKVQAGRDMEYEQYVRGEQPPHKRQKYQKADNNILAIDGSVSRTNSSSPRAIASTDPSEALWPSLEDRRARKHQWGWHKTMEPRCTQNSDRILRCAAPAKLLVRSMSITGPS
uniref:MULE domain-containing protein n=1 Tax=Trichuris muris TaxID=70415 RepID=A0A5S6QZX5_TRIMR